MLCARGGGGNAWTAPCESRRWEQARGLTWLSPSHLAAGLVSVLTLPKPLAHLSHAGVPRVSWSCLGAVAHALGSWC